jgi:hypothetical protein
MSFVLIYLTCNVLYGVQIITEYNFNLSVVNNKYILLHIIHGVLRCTYVIGKISCDIGRAFTVSQPPSSNLNSYSYIPPDHRRILRYVATGLDRCRSRFFLPSTRPN